jgi:hypothetical protein
MFDDQTTGIINPSASTTAALTLAMLNSSAGVGITGGTNSSTNSSTASIQLNQNQQQLTQLLTGKDSRWLQLEICREYQRGQCIRTEQVSCQNIFVSFNCLFLNYRSVSMLTLQVMLRYRMDV